MFSIFITFLMALSSVTMNKNSASVYPCSTPARIEKKSVSPSGLLTLGVVFLYITPIGMNMYERRNAVGK